MTWMLVFDALRPARPRRALLVAVVVATVGAGLRPSVAAESMVATAHTEVPPQRAHASASGLLFGFKPPTRPKFRQVYRSCLAPNEYAPADAIPIWKHSIPGVYVAVGTERGFIGASLAQTGKLLSVDRDVVVPRYNDIVTGLLAVSGGLSHHRELRLGGAGHAAWTHALGRGWSGDLGEVLRNPASWEFWRESVLARIGSEPESDFDMFYADPRGPGACAYQGANYLHYPEQFEKLRGMARNGNIRSLHLDLSDGRAVKQLVGALEHAQETISVLDLSNAWTYRTFERPQQAALLREVQRIATPGSILLLTGMAKKDPREFNLWDLNYFGFTFGEIDRHGGVEAFVEYLHSGKFRAFAPSLVGTLDEKPL